MREKIIRKKLIRQDEIDLGLRTKNQLKRIADSLELLANCVDCNKWGENALPDTFDDEYWFKTRKG